MSVFLQEGGSEIAHLTLPYEKITLSQVVGSTLFSFQFDNFIHTSLVPHRNIIQSAEETR